MNKVISVAVVMALLVLAGSVRPQNSPIATLTYTPKPLYNDDLAVSVSFTATRKAKPGYEWGVALTIYGREPALSCSAVLLSWYPPFGGNAKRHLQSAGKQTVLLKGKGLPSDPSTNYLCRGSAYLKVVERRIGTTVKTGTVVNQIQFRVAAAP